MNIIQSVDSQSRVREFMNHSQKIGEMLVFLLQWWKLQVNVITILISELPTCQILNPDIG